MIPTDIGEHEVCAGNPATIDLKIETSSEEPVDMSGEAERNHPQMAATTQHNAPA